MIVPYGHGFILAGVIFVLGLMCILVHRNLIMTLIGIEIIGTVVARIADRVAVRVDLAERSYDIQIGSGNLPEVGRFLTGRPIHHVCQ